LKAILTILLKMRQLCCVEWYDNYEKCERRRSFPIKLGLPFQHVSGQTEKEAPNAQCSMHDQILHMTQRSARLLHIHDVPDSSISLQVFVFDGFSVLLRNAVSQNTPQSLVPPAIVNTASLLIRVYCATSAVGTAPLNRHHLNNTVTCRPAARQRQRNK
jgi:hypothetical protein